MPKADLKRGVKICANPNCPNGGQEQPIVNFRLRAKTGDGLDARCRDCDKEKKKIVRDIQVTQGAIAILKPAANRPAHIEDMAASLIQAFGGMEQFAAHFARRVISCPDERVATAIKGLQAVIGAVNHASPYVESSSQDLAKMSDEDLKARIQEVISAQGAIDVEYEVDVSVTDSGKDA